eukprot:4516726-Pleurochrysis_carterae.AAC.2
MPSHPGTHAHQLVLSQLYLPRLSRVYRSTCDCARLYAFVRMCARNCSCAPMCTHALTSHEDTRDLRSRRTTPSSGTERSSGICSVRAGQVLDMAALVADSEVFISSMTDDLNARAVKIESRITGVDAGMVAPSDNGDFESLRKVRNRACQGKMCEADHTLESLNFSCRSHADRTLRKALLGAADWRLH